MKYRITYEQGNGYRCSCCRRVSTLTIDLDTKEDVVTWLTYLEACKCSGKAIRLDEAHPPSRWDGDDDRTVISINEISEINLDLNPDQSRIPGILKQWEIETNRDSVTRKAKEMKEQEALLAIAEADIKRKRLKLKEQAQAQAQAQ